MRKNYLNLFWTALLVCLLNVSLVAQSTFKKTFHASGEFSSAVRTQDGGFVGYGSGGQPGLVKIDSLGNLKWSLGLKDIGYNSITQVLENTDGDFFAMMTATVDQHAQLIVALVSKTGSFIKAHKFYHSSTNTAYDLESDGQGGFLMVGGGCNGNNSVIHCDKDFNIIWEKGYTVLSAATATCIIRNSKGNYIIGGDAYNSSASSRSQILFEIDITGKVIWSRSFAAFDNTWIENITELADGGYALAGYGKVFGPSMGTDVMITRTDKTGKVIWTRVMHKDWNQATDITQLTDGSLLFCGVTAYRDGNNDALIGKLSLDGKVIFLKYAPGELFNGKTYNRLQTILPVCPNKFALFGLLDGMALSFIDAQGNGICNIQTMPENGLNVIDTLFTELSAKVTETPLSFLDSAYTLTPVPNYAVEKLFCSYTDPANDYCNIITSTDDMQAEEKTVTVYPNPAGSFLTVRMNNQQGISQLKLYSVTGALVKSESNLTMNEYTMQLNGITPGIYFMEIISRSTITREKICVE